jgi:hypothetical protein
MEERGIMPPQPRQPAAIAFLDLTGYTALAEDRGDQAAAELAADLASVVQEAAQEHGGRPVKWLGDGVMYHFADPGRAILGGLDLVEQTEKAVSVPARIIINAGTVIAQEGDYFGRTVNIAARIADYARPHEVLVSEEARKRKPERCRLRADRRRTAQGRLELGEAAQGGQAVSGSRVQLLPCTPRVGQHPGEPRSTRLLRTDARMRPNLHVVTIGRVGDLLTGVLLGIGFGLPWICAIVWLCRRAGWRLLWSDQGGEFPTQAVRLRSFGGS